VVPIEVKAVAIKELEASEGENTTTAMTRRTNDIFKADLNNICDYTCVHQQ
jgi:hypothetical protein